MVSFNQLHPDAGKSSVKPLSNYIGKTPDPERDIFDRRTDVDHDPFKAPIDDGRDEPEALRNLKRFPRSIINQENMQDILSKETEELNLESHYWLSNECIGSIGTMAPNLVALSLRRMPEVTNMTFRLIFE